MKKNALTPALSQRERELFGGFYIDLVSFIVCFFIVRKALNLK
jgi:hypothetical protein